MDFEQQMFAVRLQSKPIWSSLLVIQTLLDVIDVVVAGVVLDSSALDGRRNGILTVGHCRRFTRKILIEAAEAAIVVAVHLGRRGHRRRIVDVRRCLWVERAVRRAAAWGWVRSESEQ